MINDKRYYEIEREVSKAMDPFARDNVRKAREAQKEADKQFGVDNTKAVQDRIAERERIAKQPAPKPYKPDFGYKGG